MRELDANRLLELGIAITAEKNHGKLFGLILNAAMDMTGADAGTIYTLDEDKLAFNYMITRSKNVDYSLDRGEINIPPVPLGRGHICACCALDKKLINVPDVYGSTEYDFSGAQKYDALNGYHTGSMLVAPMLDNKDNCIGVLQLINGDFSEDADKLIFAFSSFAAISLNNKLLTDEINNLFHSVVKMLVSAIDARSPYNANHTKSMARYGEKFLDYCLSHDTSFKITEGEKEPILMSIWLHDIGKLVIPLEIMDKPTRLGEAYYGLMRKLSIGILKEENEALKHPEDAANHLEKMEGLKNARESIKEINTVGFLTEEHKEKVEQLSHLKCLSEEGEEIDLLAPSEVEALSIVRGTLTDWERKIIESHVSYTRTMLNEMSFSKKYKSLNLFASSHHEFIDGSGYPDGLKGKEVPKEARLITIIDIFDALTAEDRPYKPPMPAEKAFFILEDMARNGKLDGGLLNLFIESKAWEKDNED